MSKKVGCKLNISVFLKIVENETDILSPSNISHFLGLDSRASVKMFCFKKKFSVKVRHSILWKTDYLAAPFTRQIARVDIPVVTCVPAGRKSREKHPHRGGFALHFPWTEF